MSTRSGLVYNNPFSGETSSGESSNSYAHSSLRNCPNNTSKPVSSISKVSTRPQRSTRTKFTAEFIREFCLESDDDDDSLDYSPEDEEVQQYTRNTFVNIPPRYEVNIDFDDASEAWRANKRRIGQQWAYRRPVKPQPIAKEIEPTRRSTRVTKPPAYSSYR